MEWWIRVGNTYVNMTAGISVYDYHPDESVRRVQVNRGMLENGESNTIEAFYGKDADTFMTIFLARAVVFSLTEDGRVVSTVMASDDYRKKEKE